jgi:hypothetical protein
MGGPGPTICDILAALLSCIHISAFGGVSICTLMLYVLLWLERWCSHRGGVYFYFDPQDCVRYTTEKREFPLSASTATFEPMLKHYIGVTQLLITVAAASIAFGGYKNAKDMLLIVIAKLLLAWSIFYGVLFCAFVLYRYDEYTQNVKSYTRGWYSTVESLGFAALVCFMFGYLAWGWGLSL